MGGMPGPGERQRTRPWVRPSGVFSTALQPPPPTELGHTLTPDDLAGFWLLADVPREALRPLAAASERRRYHAGERVVHQGDAPDGLYLVGSGAVRVVRRSNGTEVTLATVEAGECFGELGVIDGKPRTATAVATIESLLYFLPTEPFLDLLERTPLLALRLLGLLAARVRRTDSLALELPGTRARSRPDDA
jgi:CRP-like cAMP-binding protein